MYVLGIETSCDETSVAVLDGEGRVLSNVVSSQVQLHAEYGGVVPELAARAHLENLPTVFESAIERAGVALSDVGLVAPTAGPGLIGALLVGLSAGKAVAFARGLPLVGVNHLEGHLFSAHLSGGGGPAQPVEYPFHGLVVSGGHRELERRGVDGSPLEEERIGRDLTDLFASFQTAIVAALLERVRAVHDREGIRRLALSGGVAANSQLRATVSRWGEENGVPVLLPERTLTTDNAAMIAWAGLLRFRREGAPSLDSVVARSRWPLGS